MYSLVLLCFALINKYNYKIKIIALLLIVSTFYLLYIHIQKLFFCKINIILQEVYVIWCVVLFHTVRY